MTHEEPAEELLERLNDFSPAISVGPGADCDQVIVEIVMSRSSRHVEEHSQRLSPAHVANLQRQLAESNRRIEALELQIQHRRPKAPSN